MSDGVTISSSCYSSFKQLLDRRYKYIIFKFTEDNKEIVVEKASNDSNYETFLKDLPKDNCRYAIYDFEFTQDGGSIPVFYCWVPDAATVMSKVLLASSSDPLRTRLKYGFVNVSANNSDDISHKSILELFAKRLR